MTVGDGCLKLHALKKNDRILLGAVGTQDRLMTQYVKVYKKKRGLSAGLPADAPAQTTRPAICDEVADGAK